MLGFINKIISVAKNESPVTTDDIKKLMCLIQFEVNLSATNLSYTNSYFVARKEKVDMEVYATMLQVYSTLKELNYTFPFKMFSEFITSKGNNFNIHEERKKLDWYLASCFYCRISGIPYAKQRENDRPVIDIVSPFYKIYYDMLKGIVQLQDIPYDATTYDTIKIFADYYRSGIDDLLGDSIKHWVMSTDPSISLYLYFYYKFKAYETIQTNILPDIEHMLFFIYIIYQEMYHDREIAFIATMRVMLIILYRDINDSILNHLYNIVPNIAMRDKAQMVFSITAWSKDSNDHTIVGITNEMRNTIFNQ